MKLDTESIQSIGCATFWIVVILCFTAIVLVQMFHNCK
jgi:hypothetical protein